MSLAEMRAALPSLSPAERVALATELQNFEPFNDPELMDRLARSLDEAERGEKVLSRDELYRRLREARAIPCGVSF